MNYVEGERERETERDRVNGGDGWRALSTTTATRPAGETLAFRCLVLGGVVRVAGGFVAPLELPGARERRQILWCSLLPQERIYAGTRQLETSVVTRHAQTSQDWPVCSVRNRILHRLSLNPMFATWKQFIVLRKKKFRSSFAIFKYNNDYNNKNKEII